MSVRIAVVLACVAFRVGPADAGSFGGGPSTWEVFLFPNDTSIVRSVYTAGSSDPDIIGYDGFTLENHDAFMSFGDFRTEISSIEVYDPTPSPRWQIETFVGLPGPDLTAGNSYQNKIYVRGMWPPPEPGGVVIRVGVAQLVGLRLSETRMPATEWTFRNTSGYDIADGVLRLEPNRVIPLGDIPAGGSLTISGQLDRPWLWTFGGILNTPTPQPVYAFDPLGCAPDGLTFDDLFAAGSEFSTTGVGAALVADSRAEGWIRSGIHVGYGAPQPGYKTEFAGLDEGSGSFNLYTIAPGGTATLVGTGTQSAALFHRTWVGGSDADWNLADSTWSDGTSTEAWSNDSGCDARFAGTPTALHVAEPITARSLTFDVSGCVIDGAGPLTSKWFYVHGDQSTEATVTTPIVGIGELRKLGLGRLALGGMNAYSGGTVVTGGVLAVSSDSNLGEATKAITIENGSTLEVGGEIDAHRNISIKDGGNVRVAGDASLVIHGSLNGSGAFEKNGEGEFRCLGTIDVPFVRVQAGAFACGTAESRIAGVEVGLGGRFVILGSGESGGEPTAPVTAGPITLEGGTIVVGTGTNGAWLSTEGTITSLASSQTSRIVTEATGNFENQKLRREANYLDFYVADGPAEVDLEILLDIDGGTTYPKKRGPGTLRIGGTGNNNLKMNCYEGVLELAKPDGILACSYLRLVRSELRLLASEQLADDCDLNLAGGTVRLNGHRETIGRLEIGRPANVPDSILDMGEGFTAEFRVAEGLTSWDYGSTLYVLNWSIDDEGAGRDRLIIHDLNPYYAEHHITFVNPDGLPPGVYAGRLLYGGEIVPVPEPAMWVLVGTTALLFGGRRWRRRRLP